MTDRDLRTVGNKLWNPLKNEKLAPYKIKDLILTDS